MAVPARAQRGHDGPARRRGAAARGRVRAERADARLAHRRRPRVRGPARPVPRLRARRHAEQRRHRHARDARAARRHRGLPGAPVIDARDLVKRYGALRALDGLTLSVERGELVGLVGPNGAGKSTLIKILATLVHPDAGAAAIDGFDVVGASGRVRALVGYMPDVPGLYQDMRVRDLLEFFADAFRLRGARRRAAVEGALARAGLADRADTFVEALSLGLKQRLFIAKTLLHAPRLLLLDEPATGLDPLARIELRRLLRALNGEGITMLISSHILADLEDICSRVTFIAGGRLAGESAAPGSLTCEIEVLGDATRAGTLLRERAGVRVVERTGDRIAVEVTGGAEDAAALLRDLVAAGCAVVRFDPRGGLEERYRRAFGGTPR